jgi:membrane peptidoglycan carboxypeptidase
MGGIDSSLNTGRGRAFLSRRILVLRPPWGAGRFWPPANGRAGRPPFPRSTKVWILVLVAVVGVAWHEHRTSAIQAWVLSRWGRLASFTVAPGASPEVVYPSEGPYDERLGYTRIADFRRRLEDGGFETVEQARFSAPLARLVRLGISPPFSEPADEGLEIRDARGEPLYDFVRRRARFERFENVPLPLLRTLSYLEDRRVGEPGDPRRNPAVDWGRLVTASARYVGHSIGLPVRREGGSTLATQMEKYRHSEGGRTDSPVDKLRQMTAASLRAYREGPDTSEARRRLVVDYLDSIPLAAAPGYGEVHGLGEGLRVWFGVELDDLRAAMEQPGIDDREAEMFKRAVALLVAVRAPTQLLVRNRDRLIQLVDSYLRLMQRDGVASEELLDRALAVPLVFPAVEPPTPPPPLAEGKATAAVRRKLMSALGVPDLYRLDRLHIEATTPLDGELQERTVELFRDLAEADFVAAQGLRAPRLLDRGDPSRVVYSLLLLESTERGNVVRVHADSLGTPFDVNAQTMLELGSTAKLRTLVHYLEIVADLHASLSDPSGPAPGGLGREPRDPITRWAIDTWRRSRGIDLEGFLDRALERRYSASPHERFYTGGGVHVFHNFDPDDNARVPTVREAAVRSTNLAFVRLMRDLALYHQARLPYDAGAILDGGDAQGRRAMLQAVADQESRAALERAWRRFHGVAPEALTARLLGSSARSAKKLAIVYFAWHPDGDESGLRDWLREQGVPRTRKEVARLARAYGSRPLGLADAAWLADLAPLDLWCAGHLRRAPGSSWDETLAAADDARSASMAWLFRTRNRRAQDLRLRTRFEQDAFEAVASAWKRLGFPFGRLVPSYASAIGSSADRPAALADLMGILVNDGVRRPSILLDEIRLAPHTPYYVALRTSAVPGERVISAQVARAVRAVLEGVVENGTARRLRGAFVGADGAVIPAGGKTGSGENRRGTFTPAGRRVASDALNRTAAFTFFVGDRHFGVITASVDGPASANYRFTSALPCAVLRLLAPDIARRIAPGGEEQDPTQVASR